MQLEIQVALNFVISYLYNKLPRRRVNIFGEELEKALRDKFQGHWYPEKPFKGSAYRCLKTGEPIDNVLNHAARESGVSVSDIIENLPNELSVWIDPGEVSYRIGEKGSVKILYSESNDNHDDNSLVDGEVHKTFNPETQCFRPIEIVDIVNTNMNNLRISPKVPYAGSSPHSASSNSPPYKGSPNSMSGGNNMNTITAVASGPGAFLQRPQAPLTFTTATFAQTKFGSTKLKTNSKRNHGNSYRMSPTEFSNYIKQRAMQQQQIHYSSQQKNHFGPVSPARSLSPNPLTPLGLSQNTDPFYFPSIANSMGNYNTQRNIFDVTPQQHLTENTSLYNDVQNKLNTCLDLSTFYGFGHSLNTNEQHTINCLSDAATNDDNDHNTLGITVTISSDANEKLATTTITAPTTAKRSETPRSPVLTSIPIASPKTANVVTAPANTLHAADTGSSLMKNLNSYYPKTTAAAAGSNYQQLLVAN